MTTPGLGDRWLRGEAIPGVAFAQHAPIVVATGSRAGQQGRVVLLLAVSPEPLYLVALPDDAIELRIRQSALRAAD